MGRVYCTCAYRVSENVHLWRRRDFVSCAYFTRTRTQCTAFRECCKFPVKILGLINLTHPVSEVEVIAVALSGGHKCHSLADSWLYMAGPGSGLMYTFSARAKLHTHSNREEQIHYDPTNRIGQHQLNAVVVVVAAAAVHLLLLLQQHQHWLRKAHNDLLPATTRAAGGIDDDDDDTQQQAKRERREKLCDQVSSSSTHEWMDAE